MKNIYIIVLLLISYSVGSAQLIKGNLSESEIQKELPKLLEKPDVSGPNSVGKDFWFSVPPPLTQESVGFDNFTRVFVVASGNANVRCTQPSGVDMTMYVPAGAVKSFDLKPGECQPYQHNYSVSVFGNPAQIYPGKGINITSDQPIVVYVVVRYNATSDGYLALPTQGLGTSYVASVYDAREFGAGSLPNMLTVVGAYDRTKFKITVGGGLIPANIDILGGKRITTGESHEWTLNKGDVLVMSNVYADETLSGSLLEADKPFACISGQFCTDIPLRVRACDYTVEMDLPIQTWGQLYNIPWVRNRTKPSLLRVFSKEPNTTVWRDGQELFYFTQGVGASGGSQNNAWVEERIWPVGTSPGVAVYSADNPIYICLYNPSSQDDNVSNDPFSMLVTPVEQYQNEIVFSTPCADGGLNFTSNFLNIVFETDETNLVPEDMEFGPVQSDGTVIWSKVRTLFGGSADLYAKVGINGDEDVFKDTKHYKKQYAEKHIQLPADGAFAIRSKNRFTCYSYGFANWDSYGYPTSTALRVVSKDTLPPTIDWVMDCDGNIEGTTTDNPNPDPDNVRVGLSIPELVWDELENYQNFRYDNENFVPGNPTTSWSLKVIDPRKKARAIVVFYDRSGNVSRDTINYIPELIELRELAADDTNGDLFLEPIGVVSLASVHTRRYEIENLSTERIINLKDVKLKYKDQDFEIIGLTWDINEPLLPLEKRQFTIRFSTLNEGRYFDSVGVETECQDVFFAKISAETGTPGITVDDYSFQPYALSVDGNNPEVQSTVLRIKNECDGKEGNRPLIIIGYTNPTLAEFTHNLPNIDVNNSLTINKGEEFTFRVNFAPTAVGNYSDKIVFLTEKNLGCDPECLIDGKAIQAGIITQEYDWEKRRISYVKQPGNQYEPIASDLITAVNTTTGEFANTLAISSIKFEGVSGPAGSNNGLDAFSFDQNFATVLPANPNNYFKNITVAAGNKSPQRKVYFKPTAVGKYEISYYFESNSEEKGKETRYSIKGHGVVPNLYMFYNDNNSEITDVVPFGTITAGVPSEKVTRTITISNSPDDADNGEDLTISSINWGARATTTLANLGNANNEFYIDEAKMLADLASVGGTGTYPITLGVGESFDVDITYYTTESDVSHSTNIVITSDADESGVTGKFNNTLTLTGDALRPGLNNNVVDLYSCITNPLIIDQNYVHTNGTTYDNCFYYTNTGSKDVLIKNLTFTPKDGNTAGYSLIMDGVEVRRKDGTIDNYPSAVNISLAGGEKMIVLFTYIPSAKFDAVPKIIIMDVETDITTVEDLPEAKEFALTSNSFVRGTINLVKKADGQDLVEKINYNTPSHRNLEYIVSLDQNPDISDAQLQELEVKVEYRKGYLTYNTSEKVELIGDYASNFQIVGTPTTSIKFELDANRGNKYIVKETITFKIAALANNFINASGDLFKVSFKTGVPNIPIGGLNNGTETKLAEELYLEGRDPGKSDTYIVSSLIDPSNNACAIITPPAQITMDLDPVCAMGLRPLNLSEFNNATPGLISPHPVTSRGSNIDFSLAFDSETIIQIMNSKGDVVAVVKNEKMNAGNYSIPIPVELLSNGVYFYEISSEYLNARDKFVVEK